MGLPEFYSNLKAALESDSELAAWAQNHFQKPLTVKGGMLQAPVAPSEMPAALIESDEGSIDIKVLGGTRLEVETALSVTVSWEESDPAAALQARLELPGVLVRALMRSPCLAGAGSQTWLGSWRWQRSESPIHMFETAVNGIYQEAV